MSKEIRVYVINASELAIRSVPKTDKAFMKRAEKQRNVYSLAEFQRAFNDMDISTETDIIRII